MIETNNAITDLFDSLLAEHDSVDIAEAEFKKLLVDDEEIKEEYSEWCDSVGSSEKHGFMDYAEEYMEMRDSVWETLNDYDE
jgi:proteasome lid subunit RPN8/RPN11